jgi:hypothetical protein
MLRESGMIPGAFLIRQKDDLTAGSMKIKPVRFPSTVARCHVAVHPVVLTASIRVVLAGSEGGRRIVGLVLRCPNSGV